PVKVKSSLPLVQSHTFAVPPTEASRDPSGLKHTHLTAKACPLKDRSSWPLVLSQIVTVPSLLPEASLVPSGLKHTLQAKVVAGLRVSSLSPLLLSHTVTIPFPFTETSRVPSGLQHTALAGSASVRNSRSLALSHTFNASPVDTSCMLSGLKQIPTPPILLP